MIQTDDHKRRIEAFLERRKKPLGKPKLTCPWCRAVDRCSLNDWCCGDMQRAVFEIAEQEQARKRSDDVYSPLGIKPL